MREQTFITKLTNIAVYPTNSGVTSLNPYMFAIPRDDGRPLSGPASAIVFPNATSKPTFTETSQSFRHKRIANSLYPEENFAFE